MSERKVLNKYYPPDFDPSKIPRMKLARNRQYTVRLMAPFNMRCKTCGEYIYKGKKFNARKEDVEGDDYLGIRIYRFYIKCTRCLQEISFKTDPKNTDYEIEAGATRNFMALKLAEEQAQREEDDEKEEEATNPMKLLEKRTQQSKNELELLESLEELKDLNRRQQTINYDQMLEQYDTVAAKQRTLKEQEELDEEYVRSIFGKKQLTGTVVEEIVELNEETGEPAKKMARVERDGQDRDRDRTASAATGRSSEIQINENPACEAITDPSSSWNRNQGLIFNKPNLAGLVKKKTNDLGIKLKSNSTVSKIASETNKSDNQVVPETKQTMGGLSLLGAYSGSSNDESD